MFFWVILLFDINVVLMLSLWPDVIIVKSDVTIVVPWQLSTGSKYDYLFWYCPLVGILFEVLRIPRVLYLKRMKGKTWDGSYPLAPEAHVMSDGVQYIARLVEYTDVLVDGTTENIKQMSVHCPINVTHNKTDNFYLSVAYTLNHLSIS